MENYQVIDLVGEGSFGKVYKARRKYTGTLVAIKRIAKAGKSPRDLAGLRSEVDILRRLRHPGIVSMLDAFETKADFCVVTEFAHGELFELLEDDGGVFGGGGGEEGGKGDGGSTEGNVAAEAELSRVARQLVSALHYLHSHRVIHRDMKPQNVLLGGRGRVKLCDFGFARALGAGTAVLTSIKGTPLYMSPELVQERPYDHRADLWSLGAVLYELYTGRPPFYTSSIYALVRKIVGEPVPPLPPRASPELASFLGGLLTKDPDRRLGWPELLDHPFLRETDEERERREREEEEEEEAEAGKRGWRGERGVDDEGEREEEERRQRSAAASTPSKTPPSDDKGPVDLDRPLLAGAKPSLLVGGGGGTASGASASSATSRQQQQHYRVQRPSAAPSLPSESASPLATAAAASAAARAAAEGEARRSKRTAETESAPSTAAAAPAPSTAAAAPAPLPAPAPRSLSSRLESLAAEAATTEGAAAAWRERESEEQSLVAVVVRGLSSWKRETEAGTTAVEFASALRSAACLVALAPADAVFDGRAARLASAAASAARGAFDAGAASSSSPSRVAVSAAAAADALRAAEAAAAAAAAAVGKRFVCLPGSTESYASLLSVSRPLDAGDAGAASAAASAAASRGIADACRRAQAALAAEASPSERAAASAALAPLFAEPKGGDGAVADRLVAVAAPGLAAAAASCPSPAPAPALEALRALAAATFLPPTAAPDEPAFPAVVAAAASRSVAAKAQRQQRPSSAGTVARDLSPLVDAQNSVASVAARALARRLSPSPAPGDGGDSFPLARGLAAAAAGTAPGGRAAARLLVSVARCRGDERSSASLSLALAASGACASLLSAAERDVAASAAGAGAGGGGGGLRRAPALLLAVSSTADAVSRELLSAGKERDESVGTDGAAALEALAPTDDRGALARRAAALFSSLCCLEGELPASTSDVSATRSAAASAAASLTALACRVASRSSSSASSSTETTTTASSSSSSSSTPWPADLVASILPPEVLRAASRALGEEAANREGSARSLSAVDGFPRRTGADDGVAALVAAALAPLSFAPPGVDNDRRRAALEAGEALAVALGGEENGPPLDLSPPGARSACAALRRLGRPSASGGAAVSPAVPTLVAWLGREHLDALSRRPEGLSAGGSGGGAAAVAAAVSDSAAALHAPFSPAPSPPPSPPPAAPPSSLRELTSLLVSCGAPAALAEALPRVRPPAARAEAAGLAARLVLSSSSPSRPSSPSAARAFVEAGGVSPETVSALLDPRCPPRALVAGLLALSQLARASPEAAAALATGRGENVETSTTTTTTPRHLAGLLSHEDPSVRGRAASLAGNLARHSGEHYREMREAGLVRALISALEREEEAEEERDSRDSSSPSSPSPAVAAARYAVKKFAAFALGNAAFHSSELYPDLRGAIPALVALLRERCRGRRESERRRRRDPRDDGKAAANAAGALGNLARNSSELAGALSEAGAPQALVAVVEEEAAVEGGGESEGEDDSSPFEPRDGGSPLAVALFSLGTMVAHRSLFDPPGSPCRGERSGNLRARLERALGALDRRVALWRERETEREREGDLVEVPTTVVEKYAARVRAKLEAAAAAAAGALE